MKEGTLTEALYVFLQRCFIGGMPKNKQLEFGAVEARLAEADFLTPQEVALWDATTQAQFATLATEAITRLMLAPQYDAPGSASGCTPERLDKAAVATLLRLAEIVRAEPKR